MSELREFSNFERGFYEAAGEEVFYSLRKSNVDLILWWLLWVSEIPVVSRYPVNYVSGGGESDSAVLFCYGDPGVGKTFIR